MPGGRLAQDSLGEQSIGVVAHLEAGRQILHPPRDILVKLREPTSLRRVIERLATPALLEACQFGNVLSFLGVHERLDLGRQPAHAPQRRRRGRVHRVRRVVDEQHHAAIGIFHERSRQQGLAHHSLFLAVGGHEHRERGHGFLVVDGFELRPARRPMRPEALQVGDPAHVIQDASEHEIAD